MEPLMNSGAAVRSKTRKKGTKVPARGKKARRSKAKPILWEIGQFMRPDPVCVGSHAPLEEASLLMEEYGVRHLPVKEGEKIIGVISDRDIANGRAAGLGGLAKVGDAMSFDPFSVDANTDLGVALEIMASHRLGCVLVRDRTAKVSGIFTTTDAVRILAALIEKARAEN